MKMIASLTSLNVFGMEMMGKLKVMHFSCKVSFFSKMFSHILVILAVRFLEEQWMSIFFLSVKELLA